MGLLSFKKRKDELPTDFDLDMPPEPPKGFKGDISLDEPIDEEMMIPGKEQYRRPIMDEELPEIPPLPEMEDEMLPKSETMDELGPVLEPALPEKKKKGFFSFLGSKGPAKKLPEIEREGVSLPPLPEDMGAEEFPDIPSLSEENEDMANMPEIEEGYAPKAIVQQPIKEAKKRVKDEGAKKIKFITINDFRYIQDGINNGRASLKGVDVFFTELEDIKSDTDKRYIDLHNNLKDIQKKVVFVDKTLFKEG